MSHFAFHSVVTYQRLIKFLVHETVNVNFFIIPNAEQYKFTSKSLGKMIQEEIYTECKRQMNKRPLLIPAFRIPQAKLSYQIPWQLAEAYQLLKVVRWGAHIPLGHRRGRLELKKV